jgi:hypothetical protein
MKTNMTRVLGAGWVLSLALMACGADAPQLGEEPKDSTPAQADAQLRVELQAFESGTAKLEYRLTNPGQAPVRFLASDTAVKGALRNLFDVRREGEPVAYIGPRIDFAEPIAASFVELEPGASATRVIDLAHLYELNEPGDYTVSARARAAALFAEGPSELRAQVLVPASGLTLSVDETALTEPLPAFAAPPAAAADESIEKALQPECVSDCEDRCLFAGDPGSIGLCIAACPGDCNPRPSCPLSKDLVLNTANDDARRIIRASLPSVDSGSEAYAKWFGIETSARRAFVRNALNFALSDIFAGEQVCLENGAIISADDGVGCGTGPGITNPANAATNGRLGQNVVFCQSFFGFSAAQQAGIVVHESVHHAGVEDITNGNADNVVSPNQAEDLAQDDAEAAIRSGENYENYVIEFF